MSKTGFYNQFQSAALAYQNEHYTLALQHLNSALCQLTTAQVADEHAILIAYGMLKSKAYMNTTDDAALTNAVKHAKNAYNRLRAVWGPEHKGNIPILKQLAMLHGQLQTHYDMMAGTLEADELCPDRFDKIPEAIRPRAQDSEIFRKEVERRKNLKAEVVVDSAASRMHEAVRRRKDGRID